MADKSKRIYGHLMMFMVVLIYSFNTNFMKTLMPDWIGSYGIILLRCLASLIGFSILVLFIPKAKRLHPRGKDRWMIMLGGVVGIVGNLYFYMVALGLGGPIDGLVIKSSQPIIVLILSVIFLHGKLSWFKGIGIVLGMGGVVVLTAGAAVSGGKDMLVSDVMFFCAALLYSVYLVLIKPYSRNYHPLIVMQWMFISATVVAIPIGLKGLIEAPMWYRPFDWVVLGKVLFMLLFSTMVANVLTVTALRYISSFKASVYTYLTPLMGAVVSIWLGIQHLNWQDAISFCLIVCGFIFVNLKQHQREQNIHEPVGIH